MTLTDLMGRYCDGESEAFERIYALVAPSLFGELFAATGDRAQAIATLQRTFLDLHAARSVYVRGADPMPWIRALAQRAIRTPARATARVELRRTSVVHGGAR